MNTAISMGSDVETTQKSMSSKWNKKSGGTLHLRSIPTALMSDCISEQPYPDAALHKLINSRRKRAGLMILIMTQQVAAKAIASSKNKNTKLLRANYTYESHAASLSTKD